MTDFDTLTAEDIKKPSYNEIIEMAIRLKIRFGDFAARTAEDLVQDHRIKGDFARAEIWQEVAKSIKINDVARAGNSNKVNSLH